MLVPENGTLAVILRGVLAATLACAANKKPGAEPGLSRRGWRNHRCGTPADDCCAKTKAAHMGPLWFAIWGRNYRWLREQDLNPAIDRWPSGYEPEEVRATVAQRRKRPNGLLAKRESLKLVAGAGFEPATFRL